MVGAYEECTFLIWQLWALKVPFAETGHIYYFAQTTTGYCLLHTKDLRGNPKPRVSPDRTETGPGSRNIFKNIFGSSRVGEFYFGSVRVGKFYFGSVHVGVFFTGAWDIFSRDFGNKLAFHSKTVEVKWLLSLISTLFDVITSLQGIFTYLL